MPDQQTNRQAVAGMYDAMYAGDFDRLVTFFADDCEYTDVCSPPDDVARSPQQVAARLRLALGGVEFSHTPRLVVADGDTVVTEHVEHWRWRTGETVDLPIASVHELRDAKIVRWYDYWDMPTLMNVAPAWWVEQVMQGYQ